MAISEKDKIKQVISNTLSKLGISKAALFGSIESGQLTSDGDIGLLVEFVPGKNLLDLVGLKLKLEDILGRKADIVTYRYLHPLLINKILKEQEVFYG